MDINQKKLLPRNMIPRIIIGVMFGMVVVAVFLLLGDLKEVGQAIIEMPVYFLVPAFLFTFTSYMLRLWKWHAFSRWAKFPVTLKENAAIFFIGLMMSITPGKAGELIKSFLMQRKANVPYAKSLPIVVYDRFTDLLAMMTLVGIGLLAYPIGLPSLIILALFILLFFILLQRQSLVGKLVDLVTSPSRLNRFRRPLQDFYQQTLFFMQFRILSFSFVISVVAWLMECISLYLIIQAVSANVSFVASIFTFSLGTLAGALSMIPGGLGAAEGSIAGLLVHFGMSGTLAITVSLVIRFVTLWFGVILGIIVFLVKRKSYFPKA